ncbi:ammonia-forming cytochrome c nitrite reductase subunit c552 [Pseudomonas abyssi]|uniref:ammonia-forming cytochrome c nitrite reductase subunit c552 n=1 Tax=Pseudomonas abyssi TaxID=170540 RepID=UPI003C799277
MRQKSKNKQDPTVSPPHWRLILPALLILAAAGIWWLTRAEPNTSTLDTSVATRSEPSAPTPAAEVPPSPVSTLSTGPEYVGRQTCASCHAEQSEQFNGSHHDQAMQEANTQTVLGDFADQTFSFGGVTSRFFQREEQFWVNTANAEGEYSDYRVDYTFGVYPLQQYLLAMPGGRYQAFSVAWDARPAEEGGQRWFQLNPDVNGDDPVKALHWTGRQFNWNLMCAECHSTNLERNFDSVSNSYNTGWSEIDVSCEACHGPASNHLQWATHPDSHPEMANTLGLTVRFDERQGVNWLPNASGHPERTVPRTSEKEIQACAACHSRRAQLFDDRQDAGLLVENYLLSTLDQGLYHPDGQIQDEVFVHGSFLQSKMYQVGVTCSDCHNPHSLELRLPGDGVCLQCHQANQYQTPKHHFHSTAAGSACVDCHMPATTYMEVDPRRDHSLRVPRPDLSVTLGTPNACNQCHTDQSAEWAAEHVRQWYGHTPQGLQQYAEVFAHARAGASSAEQGLLELLANESQPAIARATAASMLQSWPGPEVAQSLFVALRAEDPQIRLGALQAVSSYPPITRWQLVSHLLEAPERVVRLQAAAQLLDIPPEQMRGDDIKRLRDAQDAYLAAQQANADDTSAQLNIGVFYQTRGQLALAEDAYQRAIELDPYFIAAYVNLADLYRASFRDPDAERLLKTGLQQLPEAAPLHFSLGLLNVRSKQMDQALSALRQAVTLDPDTSRYRYVLAVALNSTGQRAEALAELEKGLQRNPHSQTLLTLRQQLQSGQP